MTAVLLKKPRNPDLWGSNNEAFYCLMQADEQMIINRTTIIPWKSNRADY